MTSISTTTITTANTTRIELCGSWLFKIKSLIIIFHFYHHIQLMIYYSYYYLAIQQQQQQLEIKEYKINR